MWERLEGREIRRQHASFGADRGAGGGITRPDTGDRPRPDLPEGADLLPQIKHIVILMMEKPLLRQLPRHARRPGRGPAAGPRRHPPNVVNYLPNGPRVSRPPYDLHHPGEERSQPELALHPHPVRGRAQRRLRRRGGQGPCPAPIPRCRWATGPRTTCRSTTGSRGPFPLADHWFSSCLGPTFPNRRFPHIGHGPTGSSTTLPWDIVDYPEAGTIFDVLTKHGISWVNYHNVRHVNVLGAAAVRRPRPDRRPGGWRRLAGGCRGVADRAVGNKSFTADLYPLGLATCVRHLRKTEQLFADADAGTLPAVSIVDPAFEDLLRRRTRRTSPGANPSPPRSSTGS